MEKQNQPKADQVVDESNTQRREHSHRVMLLKHLWWSMLPAMVALLLIIAWAIGNNYLAHFKLGDQLLSTRLSNASLKQTIAATVNSYQLKIVYPDGAVKTFPLSAIGITPNTNQTVSALRKQQDNLANRVRWWQPIAVHIITSTNTQALNSFVASNVSIVRQPPQNAALTVKNGNVQLASAIAGEEYSLPNANQTIVNIANHLQNKPVKLQLVSLRPTLTTAELAVSESKLKQAINQPISFSIGSQAVTPTPSTIASWITLTPNLTTKNVNISVNSSAVTSYVDRIAGSYVRVAKDQVNITNADGSTSVLVAGSAGQTVGGTQSTVTAIGQNLLAGKGLQFNLPVTTTAYGNITAGDWPKWIEVNLTTKRMYAYEYGNLVNSFLVSAGKPSTPTPTGEFHIWEKLTTQTMTGPGYVQPNVPWINYFDHSGDAIHGNYWRAASVFGSVNTSHGCVGLPVSQSEWVYDWAPIGTPIIIHK